MRILLRCPLVPGAGGTGCVEKDEGGGDAMFGVVAGEAVGFSDEGVIGSGIGLGIAGGIRGGGPAIGTGCSEERYPDCVLDTESGITSLSRIQSTMKTLSYTK